MHKTNKSTIFRGRAISRFFPGFLGGLGLGTQEIKEQEMMLRRASKHFLCFWALWVSGIAGAECADGCKDEVLVDESSRGVS